MPRFSKGLIFCLSLFFLLGSKAVQAEGSTVFFTSEQLSQGTEVVLPSSGAKLVLPPNSLSRYSRVAFFTTSADNSLSSANSYFYNWQILDADVKQEVFVYLPLPADKEGLMQVWQRGLGERDWREVNFVQVGSQLKVATKDKQGQLAITSLPLAPYSLYLDKETISKGFQVQMPGGYFTLHIPAQALSAPATIKITPVPAVYPLADKFQYLSPLFYFQVLGEGVEIVKPLVVDIHFPAGNSDHKEIYAWNNQQKEWQVSPSSVLYKEGVVRTATWQKELLVTVLSDGIMEKGKASWYAYKGGMFAASPDYPKGTKLKVTNLANGKSVIVEINDYGPDRSIHPDRVIDLDKVAFARIASLRLGLAEVVVDPLYPVE